MSRSVTILRRRQHQTNSSCGARRVLEKGSRRVPAAESPSPEPEDDERPVGHEGLQEEDGDTSGLLPVSEPIATPAASTAADARRFAEELDGEQATGLAEFYTDAYA